MYMYFNVLNIWTTWGMPDLFCHTFKHSFCALFLQNTIFFFCCFFFSRADSGDMCGLSGEVLNCYRISREAISSGNLESLSSGLPKINLALRSTVNGLSVKRLPTVPLPTLWGPHSSTKCSPTAKYRLVNLTSELRCLWETRRSVVSHVPIQEAHCRHSWEVVGWVGRLSSRRENLHLVCGCWWVQPHCLLCD